MRIFIKDAQTTCLGSLVSVILTTMSEFGFAAREIDNDLPFPTTQDGSVLRKSSLYGTMRSAFEAYADRPCLGVVTEPYSGDLPRYRWYTYRDIHALVQTLASQLRSYIRPGLNGLFGILSENSLQWILADLAVLFCGGCLYVNRCGLRCSVNLN